MTKKYTNDYYDFFNEYISKIKKCNLFITKNIIEKEESFLASFIITTHEYYHLITRIRKGEKWNKVPKDVQQRIEELDKKNLRIVLELQLKGVSQEEINKKIVELEEQDRKEFPDIIKMEDEVENQPDIMFFTNINKKSFEIETQPSPSFVEYDKTIPCDIKGKMRIYNHYVNPKTKNNGYDSDFYCFLDEFAAEIQSIQFVENLI